AATGEADVGFARLARAVDDAADDRDGDRRRDVREALFEALDGLNDLELLAGAGGAGDHGDAAAAQVQRLQNFEAGLHLLDRIGGQRDADRVADAGPQQHAEPDRGFDRAAAQSAGLGDPQMERVVAGFRELLIGGDGEKHVGGFARDLELEEVIVFEDLRVV